MNSWRSRVRILGVAGAMAITIPLSSMGGHLTPTVHAAGSVTRITGSSIGTTAVTNTVVGAATQSPQTDEFPASGPTDDGGFAVSVNRTLGTVTKGNGRVVTAGGTAKSNPSQIASFEGLNHFMSRYANNGNQFSLEPPDQALCAGNGYVVEGVNDAIAVYQRNGTASTLDAHTSLNQFYNFAPAIVRSTGRYGPEVTDPVCYFDPATQHFFFAVLTLRTSSNGAWYGGNTLDIAVSQTANPLSGWNLFSLDVTGAGPADCPCLADYPKIGADSNGIYITTDDFPLAGPGLDGGFNEADIYGLSKQDLLAGHLDGWFYSTSGLVNGDPGYVVWPTTAPGGKYETAAGGTQYFVSTTLDACSTCASGSDNRVAVWALTNTSNLASATTAPTLSNTIVNVASYVDPPYAAQKSGNNPTGQAFYRAGAGTVGALATNDAGSRGAVFANGKLWGAFNTGVTINGQSEAAVEYYVITPDVSSGSLTAKLALQGTLALPNASLIFPSIGVTPSGRGILSFTQTGPNDFPSAAYAPIDAKVGAGPVTIAAAGQDSQDGFGEYGSRPRWGDYGATAVDGNTIWMASEYIAHACSLATFVSDSTCGGTRTSLANWSTRITAVNLAQ